METIFFLFLLFGLSASLVPSTLRLVNVLYRHGDRSPPGSFPTDPNDFKTTWPSGRTYLTPLGMKESYATGVFLRKRYAGFLSDVYRPYEIRVESSDADRCLMTAYTNLAGLYPPKGYQIWNPNMLWQPIPVHTRPVSEDHKLKLGESRCPRFSQLYDERLKTPEMMKEVAQNKDFKAYVHRQAGVTLNGWLGLFSIYDTLYCEQQHNITWAPWVTPAIFERLQSLMLRMVELRYSGKEQGRLMGGPLLKQFVDNMQFKVNGSPDARAKMFIYSAHGETIIGLFTALGKPIMGVPYTSTVMTELHEENGHYNVQMFYRNFTTTDVNDMREATPLTIPGCTLQCPFDQFISLTRDAIPIDWEVECALKNESSATTFARTTTKPFTGGLEVVG